MSFLADALWHDLKYGVLARSRESYDACAAAHAAGDVDLVVSTARDAFTTGQRNFKDAVDHAWGHVKRRDLRRAFEERVGGRRDPFLRWFHDVVTREAPEIANSRLFLDPPHPDRVWVQRGTEWNLAWRRDGEWRLRGLKEVRDSGVDPVETLLTIRVGGEDRPNPRLPA